MEHLNEKVENIFHDVNWVEIVKKNSCFIFIYVVMDLLSSVLKKCVCFDGDCERHGND